MQVLRLRGAIKLRRSAQDDGGFGHETAPDCETEVAPEAGVLLL
jgi:hypothetical protein